ncbi:MAG: LysE family transporter [Syntrophomonas sp.]|nr:LysE family transporter [Syntrophomonas sp.]
MFKYFLQGLLLGFAYVAPIGIQNLYLINTAARENLNKTLKIAVIIMFFDISLALACFFGVGILIESFPILKGIILITGSIAVIYIGYGLIRSQPQLANYTSTEGDSVQKVVGICFAITWFNPQAIIDGSLLLGSINASLPNNMSAYFILGVCLASCLWFLSVAIITSVFRTKINTNVMRWINVVCGTVIIFYGIKLGYSFTQLVRISL